MIWTTRFTVNPYMGSFPHPSVVSEQSIEGNYYYDGSRRGPTRNYLFEYSLKGEGVFWNADGEHRVPEGAGFLCKTDDPETGYYYPEDSTEIWRIFFFTFYTPEGMISNLLNRYGPVFHIPQESSVIQRFLDCQEYAGKEHEVTPGEGASFVMRLLCALADIGAEKRADTPAAFMVNDARRIIRQHLEENINVSELADILKVTSEHLCRTFKTETGLTPLAYITQERVRRAAELLQDKSLSVKEVSGRLNFDTSSHFARTFKKITGRTPGEFRREGGIYI